MPDRPDSTKSMPDRELRLEESELIRALLCGIYSSGALETALTTSRVVDMQDGGMGSVRFTGSEPRRFGRVLVEAEHVDSDGILLSISVNADDHDRLFELDLWKVDYSALKRYPRPSEITIKSTPRKELQ
jgi:hypothetical protein